MAIRDLVTVDGRPACEVDTAEELTQVLVPGVWVRARRRFVARRVRVDRHTENADTAEIAAGSWSRSRNSSRPFMSRVMDAGSAWLTLST